MEVELDVVAAGAVCHHDVTGHVPLGNGLPDDIAASDSRLRGVHFVLVHFVCPVLCAILRQAKVEQVRQVKEIITRSSEGQDEAIKTYTKLC